MISFLSINALLLHNFFFLKDNEEHFQQFVLSLEGIQFTYFTLPAILMSLQNEFVNRNIIIVAWQFMLSKLAIDSLISKNINKF